tara:strand:- start:59 stop:307 length:249 start_codon:yes stop_codon:yes gene_type:complete
MKAIFKWLFYNRNSAHTRPFNLECIGEGYYLPSSKNIHVTSDNVDTTYTYVEYKRDDWGVWYKTDNYVTQDAPAACQVVGYN